MRRRSGASSLLVMCVLLSTAEARGQELPDPTEPPTTRLTGGTLPYKSTFGISLAFPGGPNLLGICVSGSHEALGLEFCAGNSILVVTASVAGTFMFHKADLTLQTTADGQTTYSGMVQNFGLLGGIRGVARIFGWGDDLPPWIILVSPIPTSWGPELGLTYEAIHWTRPGRGIRVGLNIGGYWTMEERPRIFPFWEVKFGALF